jgi:two-component system, cell cycle response regulator
MDTNKQTINALLIEDNPDDVALMQVMLHKSGCNVKIETAERLSTGLERIGRDGLDIIILDMNLADSLGIDTLTKVLDKTTSVPIIVFTGLVDEAVAMEAVRHGAQDYLVKGEIDGRILKRSIHYAIERKQLITALEVANERLSRQVTTDPLTGIYNRLKFNDLLDAEVLRAKRYGTSLSLIMFDIDYFKRINDTHGHQIGDYVLREISRIVSENIRQPDIFARWGGEEFMVLVPNDDVEQASILAEKLRALIEAYNFRDNLKLTASFGVTGFRRYGSFESFTSRVDEALYKAKRNGRNRVEVV